MHKDKFRIYIFNKLPLSVETLNFGGRIFDRCAFYELMARKSYRNNWFGSLCAYEAYVVSIIYCHFIETIKRDQILNDIFCVTCRPHNQSKWVQDFCIKVKCKLFTGILEPSTFHICKLNFKLQMYFFFSNFIASCLQWKESKEMEEIYRLIKITEMSN